MAIMLGLGMFAIIVAIGWRSVQNRRILRMQGANGQETIIIASEDDEVTNVTTTTTDSVPVEPAPAPEFGRSAVRTEMVEDAETDAPRTTTS